MRYDGWLSQHGTSYVGQLEGKVVKFRLEQGDVGWDVVCRIALAALRVLGVRECRHAVTLVISDAQYLLRWYIRTHGRCCS